MDQVVFTNKAACRDCFRCVRVCPVKAIKFADGQALVQDDKCISCGACIRECPQGAKQYRKDFASVIELIEAGNFVVASVAPTYPAFFNQEWEKRGFPSALRALGFSYISETAIGAEILKFSLEDKFENLESSVVSSTCPSLVRYIELYREDSQSKLIKLDSPMGAHAKYLRSKFGDKAKIVFIGPCAAKKREADDLKLVDYALTFEELDEWFKLKNIQLKSFEESFFDDSASDIARLYPISGGLLKLQYGAVEAMDSKNIAVSGFEDVKESLDTLQKSKAKIILEPLMCKGGCINGPGFEDEKNSFQRRLDILSFKPLPNPFAKPIEKENFENISLTRDFRFNELIKPQEFTEEEIDKILAKTGKVGENNQLNCGSCGYSSCREQAIAALNGMAEAEICIPYMRRIAEQKTNKILEADPNGILIVNDKLQIVYMNPSFKKMFMCDDQYLGQRISQLIDPTPFEKMVSGEREVYDITVKYDNYNLICRQTHYSLPEENRYVGVFVNSTNLTNNSEKLKEIREKTIMQARELLEHQTQMAQQMARFLGENTAKGEQILRNLLELAREKQGSTGESWLWDIYTSK